jgi:hypothetical protein
MSLQKVGRCSLCLSTGELRLSHFMPKALYRLVRSGTSAKNSNVVQVTAKGLRETSRQAMQYLLCPDCEERFNRSGEDWILKHCYRGRGVFRLRELVKKTSPFYCDSNSRTEIYSASAVRDLNVDKIAYFVMSVLWRASVTDWRAGVTSRQSPWEGMRSKQENIYLGRGPFQRILSLV